MESYKDIVSFIHGDGSLDEAIGRVGDFAGLDSSAIQLELVPLNASASVDIDRLRKPERTGLNDEIFGISVARCGGFVGVLHWGGGWPSEVFEEVGFFGHRCDVGGAIG